MSSGVLGKMDFALDATEQGIQKLVRRFATEEIAPLVAQIDRDGAVPREVFQKLARIGYWGLSFPGEWGGAGGSMLTAVVAMEELARVCGAVALASSENIAAARIIGALGSQEQKEKYLRPLIKGERIGAWGFTEAATGSDPRSLQTRARRDGDYYILNGAKLFITDAPHCDMAIIYARTAEDRIGAFIVEKTMEGFKAGKVEDLMGLRGSGSGELKLTDVRVPKDNVIGKADEGLKALLFVVPEGKVLAAAQALGVAQAALDESIKYAQSRLYRGRSISSFHTIQRLVARMAARTQAARWMVYWGGWRRGEGKLTNTEASMIKTFTTDVAAEVGRYAFRLHGPYGASKGSAIERIYRDALVLEVVMMTTETNEGAVGSALLTT